MPAGDEVTVPEPVPARETIIVCEPPAPPTETFRRSELRMSGVDGVEQLTRTRTSPVPEPPLTKSAGEPGGASPATSASVVPSERESSGTHVESDQRNIEIVWVQVV